MEVDDVLADLRLNGWAEAVGTAEEFSRAVSWHGFTAVRTQRGAPRQVLRPHTQESAPAQSMSAHYGMGAQPLHTDGAHLRVPPDVVVLYAPQPNDTPTMVWSGISEGMAPWHPEFAQHGVFTVRNGQQSFLAAAAEGAQLRFDPVCMSAADNYARQSVDYFTSRPAKPHYWDSGNKLLIIDNRRSLHARAAVAEGDESRKLERLTFRWARP